jgi:TatD DNase family protein
MFIDTHAHLCDPKFDADREDVLARAAAEGIGIIVEIADKESEWEKARLLSQAHPGRVFWSAGLHPYYADQRGANFADNLARAVKDPACVAVGEIGLDYFKNTVPRAVQIDTFALALKLTRDFKKPAVIHCRDAQDPTRPVEADMEKIIGSLYPAQTTFSSSGVLHCFQGSLALAQFCIARGFFIGVDAPLTYKKAQPLRDLMAALPLDKIVLETDSPYLPPEGLRGERNEPRHVKAVAQALAAVKNIPIEDVETQTTQNAKSLYRLK